jgi:hypothetical protein
MNKLRFIYFTVIMLSVSFSSCKKEGISDDTGFLNTAGSSNADKIFDITDDNSGNVKITPLGNGFTKFDVKFGDAAGESATVTPGSSVTHSYAEGSYTVTIDGYDIAGKVTTATYPLSLTYRAPENLQVTVGDDAAISATADFANSFQVYYGDVANETPTTLAVGATLPAHIYPAGGPYQLKVVAQSGGAATTTYTKTLFGFPIDFENASVNYFFGTFGNVVFSTADNPAPGGLNTSAKVGKYEKPVGAETWSGTYSPLDIGMNLAYGKKIKVLVYNPSPANIGKQLNIELEAGVAASGAPANGVAVLKRPITTSGAWEELVFDFSPISAIPATARFEQLVLRFNDVASGAGETIYVDNFRITN